MTFMGSLWWVSLTLNVVSCCLWLSMIRQFPGPSFAFLAANSLAAGVLLLQIRA